MQPTLWRTCRALANRHRLRLMQRLLRPPARTVTEAARDVGLPLAVACQYLRLLNARGMLTARRTGRWVLYTARSDPSVPQAGILLSALRRTLATERHGLEKAFAALTGLTHPRRVLLVRALQGGPQERESLCRKTGISRQALGRHLRKLAARGYATRVEGRWCAACPPTALGRALASLARRSRRGLSP